MIFSTTATNLQVGDIIHEGAGTLNLTTLTITEVGFYEGFMVVHTAEGLTRDYGFRDFVRITRDRLNRTLAHRVADIANDITDIADELVADGAHQDSADIEDMISNLTDLISPVNPDTGDPIDQADHNRAEEVIFHLLNDAITHQLEATADPHDYCDCDSPLCSLPHK